MTRRGLLRTRAAYAALALATIAIGLVVHLRGAMLHPDVRDILGDALWAMMVVWWIGVLAPRAAPGPRGAAALAICFAVEASQRVHTPTLDAIRRTTPGHLVLGSGYDPRDLAAYTLGVLLAVSLERAVLRRARSERHRSSR